MLIPRYWAEGRLQRKAPGRQVTVRRFGWSDDSPAAAQAHADARTQAALERVWSGESLPRREPKVPYNGAEGVPIREEIVNRQGDVVITRNSYGALCLNTPNVLFADVDYPEGQGCRTGCSLYLLLAGALLTLRWMDRVSTPLMFVGLLAAIPLAVWLAGRWVRFTVAVQGGHDQIIRRRLQRFVSRHPDWGIRTYQTPRGWRLLVTHQTFSPQAPDVAAFFDALGTDPMYRFMCERQQCFRARVSPKPWRIGMAAHLKPQPGVWPIAAERMPARAAWVQEYERLSQVFAACTFVDALGTGHIHADVRPVLELHDQLCRATSGLPIA